MALYLCKKCEVRRLATEEGRCVRCGSGLESWRSREYGSPENDGLPLTFWQIRRLLGDIHSQLETSWSDRCMHCQEKASTVLYLGAEHRDFSAILPLALCEQGLRQFTPPWWRRYLNALAAAYLDRRPGPASWIAWKSEPAREALRRISIYRDLADLGALRCFRWQGLKGPVTISGSDVASYFHREARLHRLEGWGYADEPDRPSEGGLPLGILQAIWDGIDRRILAETQSLTRHGVNEIQVTAVFFPERQQRFEIIGAGHRDAERLQRELETTFPDYSPTTITYASLRRRLLHPWSDEDLQLKPFSLWNLSLAPGLATGLRDQCQVPAQDVAPHSVDEDLQEWRKRFPDKTELIVHQAERAWDERDYDQAVSFWNQVIGREPEKPVHRHRRIMALHAADQTLLAAAQCRDAIPEFPHDLSFRAHLAFLQLQLGHAQDAIDTTSEALERQNDPEVHFVRAHAFQRLGDVDSAFAEIEAALALQPDYAECLLLKAQLILQHRNDLLDAIQALEAYHLVTAPTEESLHLLAYAFSRTGRDDRAVEVLEEGIASLGGDADLELTRAEYLANTGKIASAIEACDQVLVREPDSTRAFSIRALLNLESGDLEAATRDAERAIELGGDTSRVHMVLGVVAARQGDLDRAESEFTRGIELDPENSATHYHRASVLGERGEYDRALEDLDAAIEFAPNWAEPRIRRAFVYLMRDRRNEAAVDLDRAIEDAPSAAEAYWGRSLIRTSNGDQEGALADLDRAIELDPDDARYRLTRTEWRLKERDEESAKADLDAALAADPDFIPALFRRAHLHLHRNDPAAAKRDFDAILKLDPEEIQAFIGRSVANERTGDAQEADADIDAALRLAPEEREAVEHARWLMLASAAFDANQHDVAIDYAEKALEASPEDSQALRIRAAANWYREDFVEALEDYERLIERADPPAYDLWIARAQVRNELGEFAQALPELERGVEAARENHDNGVLSAGLNGLGRALAGLQRYEEAERAFDESLRLRPDNAWLAFNRGLLHLARENREAAAACFDLALHLKNPALPPRKRARASRFLEGLGKQG